MHIEKFSKELRNDINDFEAHWVKRHKEDPKNWPLSLDNSGEWYEQFIAWLGTSEEVK